MTMQMNMSTMYMSMGGTTPDTSDLLLARHADSAYWMARYLERAENLARLLEVTHIFSPASSGVQNWQSVLQIHQDTEHFEARYATVSAPKVVRFYLTDDENPNSIYSCLNAVRSNASILRAHISTELWVQINSMYNHIRTCKDEEMKLQDISALLAKIRRKLQTAAGIAEQTLYRDQSWYFHVLGRQLERADQTTRLLDIKYHLLLPSVSDVGSTLDLAQWVVVLRAVSGYHAFRREHPHKLTPSAVVGFLLFDERFPRSLRAAVNTAGDALRHLRNDYRLNQAEEALGITVNLLQTLGLEQVDRIVAEGLHEYFDQMQLRFMEIHTSLARRFFPQ